MSLYLKILILSALIPFSLSFDRNLAFFRKWKFVFPAILLVALIYILFDIVFTARGIWGFNPRYHSNTVLFGLPLEEYLFFIVIPYASLFLHYAFILYFPEIRLNRKLSNILSFFLITFLFIVMLFNWSKLYTVYIFSFTIIAVLFDLINTKSVLPSYFVTFLLILIPFLIVNSFLTGSFIDGEIFWYDNTEILGIRILTIPIEDLVYAFSMILFSLMLTELFERKIGTQKRIDAK